MRDKIDMNLYRILISSILFVAGLIFHEEVLASKVLLLFSYIIVGYETFIEAVKNLCHGKLFDENFLMVVATIGAIAIKEYPEAVAVMLFFQIGEYIEHKAVEKSKKAVTSLAGMRSDQANLKRGEKVEVVAIEEVKVNDQIVVKPGERIPLDGVVLEGKSNIDSSMITGESLPLHVLKGSKVISGCINLDGVLTLQVESDVTTSTVSKILDLMEHASEKKTVAEQFITKFARYYTPIVVVLALLIAVIPVLFGGDFSVWLYRSLVFLTISCPCALVISIPLGFISGLGLASKHGVLFKGTNYMEVLNEVETVVFDKTGTLTKGVFEVVKVTPVKGYTKDDIVEYAAIAEHYSNHPLAYPIQKASKRSYQPELLSDYQERSGKGISVLYEKNSILIGNEAFMEENSIKIKKEKMVGTVLYVAYNHKYVGSIVVADEIKEDAKKLIDGLKDLGIKRFILLSGDNEKSVDAISKQLGITEYYANLLPQEKVEKVEKFKRETKGTILFIGDGMNDAPVLALSDLGVSMGGIGSDAAIEASDIVIMDDQPSRLISAIKISRKTKKIVWQNIVFAITVKVLVLILGAFGIANIWHAVFADVGVTLLAILYSFTIYLYKEN